MGGRTALRVLGMSRFIRRKATEEPISGFDKLASRNGVSMVTEQGLLETWRDRARVNQKVHYDMAERLQGKRHHLGVPSMVLSTAAGTAVFVFQSKALPDWATICVGLASFLAAVLSGLQSYFGHAVRAEKHRTTAQKFGALHRQIERLLATTTSDQSIREQLVHIEERWNDLSSQSPAIPRGMWSKVAPELTPKNAVVAAPPERSRPVA